MAPRAHLDRWVAARAFRGEDFAVTLGDMGFSTVMLHGDLFRPADRAVLEDALARMDDAPAVSRDGGERVAAYDVPRRAGVDARAAWARWAQNWK